MALGTSQAGQPQTALARRQGPGLRHAKRTTGSQRLCPYRLQAQGWPDGFAFAPGKTEALALK